MQKRINNIISNTHGSIISFEKLALKTYWGYFLGPVVKTLPSNAMGTGLMPGQGTKITHAMMCGQRLKSKIKQNIGKIPSCFSG